MHALLEFLRASAPVVLGKFAWPMFWQSSVLFAALLFVDALLRKWLRPATMYSLWLLLLIKLVLPPSLSLPTSLAWWLRPSTVPAAFTESKSVIVTDNQTEPSRPAAPHAMVVVAPVRPPLPNSAWGLMVWIGVSAALLGIMLKRWRQIARRVSNASPAPTVLATLLEETVAQAGVNPRVQLKLTEEQISPALCGFLQPVILLSRSVAEELDQNQLKAVLLHELTHLRRGDIWLNTIQSLLQIVYWWHPLLWIANSRIRGIREEAVDDAVMLALREDASTYISTLLEVAKLTVARPLSALGFVGIFETKAALRERILRIDNLGRPVKPGLTFLSGVGVVGLAIVALPMGSGPKSVGRQIPSTAGSSEWPDPHFAGYSNLELRARFFIADAASLHRISLPIRNPFSILDSNSLWTLKSNLQKAAAKEIPESGQLQFQKFSGGHFTWLVGGPTNNSITYQTRTAGGKNVVTGALAQFGADEPAWVPLKLQVIPWNERDRIRCQVALTPARSLLRPEWSEAELKTGGALLWVRGEEGASGHIQVVLLEKNEAEPSLQIQIHAKFIKVSRSLTAVIWPKLGLHNSGKQMLTTLLTSNQVAILSTAVKMDTNSELLAESTVITLPGRQAQMQVVEAKTVVMNIEPEALTPPGVPGKQVPYVTTNMTFGPILDVIPYLSTNKLDCELTVSASFSEFLGYDKPDKDVTVYLGGKAETAVMPLPRFRVRKITTPEHFLVPSGYTLLLGNPVDETGQPAEAADDKVKSLFVLLTTTFVDPP